MKRFCAVLGVCALLVACATPVTGQEACPVTASKEWNAWINAMPPGPPTLVVVGKVQLPTPGYTVTLELGELQESEPPTQIVNLVAVPPEGPVTQVLTWYDVRYEGPAQPEYDSVVVRCGDKVLANIIKVPTAY